MLLMNEKRNQLCVLPLVRCVTACVCMYLLSDHFCVHMCMFKCACV